MNAPIKGAIALEIKTEAGQSSLEAVDAIRREPVNRIGAALLTVTNRAKTWHPLLYQQPLRLPPRTLTANQSGRAPGRLRTGLGTSPTRQKVLDGSDVIYDIPCQLRSSWDYTANVPEMSASEPIVISGDQQDIPPQQ